MKVRIHFMHVFQQNASTVDFNAAQVKMEMSKAM
jgi:hypothetical protein